MRKKQNPMFAEQFVDVLTIHQMDGNQRQNFWTLQKIPILFAKNQRYRYPELRIDKYSYFTLLLKIWYIAQRGPC